MSHIPSHDGTRKALELTLRQAIRLDDRSLDTTHVTLGLLRADDPQVRAVLFTLRVDPTVLRADLERSRRRSA